MPQTRYTRVRAHERPWSKERTFTIELPAHARTIMELVSDIALPEEDGYTRAEDRERALAAGFRMYVAKNTSHSSLRLEGAPMLRWNEG